MSAEFNPSISVASGGFKMARNLSGKTALVTGASAGIGKAIVKNLVEHGLSVIATGRTGKIV